MSTRFAFTLTLAFLATSSIARGEIMSIEEFMVGELESAAATKSGGDENPFEDAALVAPTFVPVDDDAARTGINPYRIETPDVITIDLVPVQGAKERELSPKIAAAIGRRLVGPDGKINLGEFGQLYVHGMTLDEASEAIQKKLSKVLPAHTVRVDIHAANSKRYYVVTTRDGQGDEVAEYAITGNETVLDALVQAGQSADVNRVWIVRPSSGTRWEKVLPVNWTELRTGKSDKTNYALLPGDRVYVQRPAEDTASVVTDAPEELNGELAVDVVFDGEGARSALPVRPVPAPPSLVTVPPQPYLPQSPQPVVYSAFPAATGSPFGGQPVYSLPPLVAEAPYAEFVEAKPASPATVRFEVVVVEDVGDSFAEFEQLRTSMPFMLTDTPTITGTLRALEKHKLVRRVAAPKLMVATGDEATFQVGTETPNAEVPWTGTKATMGARELGGGLAVDFSYEMTADGRANTVRASLIVPHGQSVVMKTGDEKLKATNADAEKKDGAKHAVYVVLTPEIVK